LIGRFFGGGQDTEADLQAEINTKMSRVLEDTLMKNLQLQSDMEIMGDEIARLEEQIKDLRGQIVPISESL
jgi:polyhydroxyalkanoate synthesis regulator phasin